MKKRWIFCTLLFLFLGLASFIAWQMYQEAIIIQVSDEQINIKPDLPSFPAFPDNTSEDTALPQMNFTEVQTKNHEIGAWLSIEGLGIDYPIVQNTDNSYYLDHTAEKKYNKLGALFLDFRNNADYSDFNSIIYGHNITSGQMFGRLPSMKEPSNFNSVTTGYLYTPAKTYRLDIFAVLVGGSKSEFYNYVFASPQEKQIHLDMIKQSAKCYRDIGITVDDRILSLSTCSYEYNEARTLVIAKLVA